MIHRRAFPLIFAVLAALLLAACGTAAAEDPLPPRPTAVVITASGPYVTTFDTAEDWLVGESAHSTGSIVDGAYHLSVDEPSTLAWTHQPRAFGDAVYEVDAQLVRGAEASAFGLLLLGSSDLHAFFYCMITGDGRYDVGYCKNGCATQESLIGGLTLSYAVLTGFQQNHIRVELAGGELTMLVNGTPVSQITGVGYSEGLVGLIGESSPYGEFEAAFDNLQVVEGTSLP